MSQELAIEVIRPGHELVLGGRLDVRSSPVARVALQLAVDDGVGDMVVHVERLQIWDASGLGVLVGAHRRAARAGRRLVLAGLAPREARLIRAARLHRLLRAERTPAGV